MERNLVVPLSIDDEIPIVVGSPTYADIVVIHEIGVCPSRRVEGERILGVVSNHDRPVGVEGRLDIRPKSVIEALQFGGNFRMLNDDVRVLMTVGREIVKLVLFDQPPRPLHDARILLSDRSNALTLDDKSPVGERLGRVAQGRGEINPIKPRFDVLASKGQERGKQVGSSGQTRHIRRCPERASRPPDKERDVVPALSQFGFPSALPVVVELHAMSAAIIARINQDGVLPLPGFPQPFFEAPHILVEIGDHGDVGPQFLMELFRLRRLTFAFVVWRVIGAMGNVQWKITEKWLLLSGACLHPLDALSEENVSAVAGILMPFAIAEKVRIKIIVPPMGSDLFTDGCLGKPEGLLKTAVLRAHWIVVAKVPLPKDAGVISILPENFRHGGEFNPHVVSFRTDIARPVAHGVDASHELGAARRTHGRNVEIIQSDAFVMEPIHIGCFEKAVPVAGEVTEATVVCDHKDHVRAAGNRRRVGFGKRAGGSGGKSDS